MDVMLQHIVPRQSVSLLCTLYPLPLLLPASQLTLPHQNNDPNIGSAQDPKNNNRSVSGLVSTLIPIGIVAGIMVLVFLLLRRFQRRQYAPRTFLSSLREQYAFPTTTASPIAAPCT